MIIYQTEDGLTKIDVAFENDTVWLSLEQMAELFQRDRTVIGRHIKNVFSEGELQKNSVCAKFAHTAADGKTYQVDYYNLDMIISVGYRVKSQRGVQFRIWASGVIKEYMKKGFAIDDQRLKELGGGNYFHELLERIRDIRASEKVFYRQVLEIYATSIDYDPQANLTHMFFATVQNKLHYAAHQHTAAEVIYERVDAEKPMVGMTNFKGNYITREDVQIAKNYLTEQELTYLNLLVSQYLDFAEVQALGQIPMKMAEWIEKLDELMRMSGRQLLVGKGTITHEVAKKKAIAEFEKYRKLEMLQYESDYDRAIKELIQKENSLPRK